MTKLINSKTFENQKKVKEGFGDPINNFFDEVFSYLPWYFRLPINFFRNLINKGLNSDPIYFLYCYLIFAFIKVYIRGRVMTASETYYESVV